MTMCEAQMICGFPVYVRLKVRTTTFKSFRAEDHYFVIEVTPNMKGSSQMLELFCPRNQKQRSMSIFNVKIAEGQEVDTIILGTLLKRYGEDR